MTKNERRAVDIVRRYVINQSRYQLPEITDEMYKKADAMSDAETLKFLEGKDIISDNNLLLLTEDIGMEDLLDEDGWVDPVCDYIAEHVDDCDSLIAFLQS